jgi:hypothetical protein
MAEITATVWINEIKTTKLGELWKCAESHSKKNEDGTYSNAGSTYFDVFVEPEVAGTFPQGSRVVISGWQKTVENEVEGKKYRNLVVSAKSVIAFQPAAGGQTAAPAVDENAPF